MRDRSDRRDVTSEPKQSGTDPRSAIARLRRGMAEAGLDCGCRQTADELLDRIGGESEIVMRAEGLADARRMRDAIVVILALLCELDELTPDEPDRSAFLEISTLFRDIEGFATHGVEAALGAAGYGDTDGPGE